MGVLVAGLPVEGTRDWRARGQSKSTLFGPHCTRQLVRVSPCLARSLLSVCAVETLVKNTPLRGGA